MRMNREELNHLEEQLSRIANVEAAAIHFDERGEVSGVDIVADRSRSPQRIVRDVEIVLRQGGLDVDHRKIGVAALSDPGRIFASAQSSSAARNEEPSTPDPTMHAPVNSAPTMAVLEFEPDSERVRLTAVHSTNRDGSFSAEVELALGAYEGIPGRAEGPAQESVGCATLVARATLEAVRNLLQPGYETQLRELRIIDMGGIPLVAVTVDFGEGRRLSSVAGACLQRGSLYDTAVYATLDAINRPLGRARFRQLAVVESEQAEQRRRA